MTTKLAECFTIILLVAAMVPYICGRLDLGPQKANAWDVPPKPHPVVSFDVYTQKDGRGSNSFGGTFSTNENVVLFVEIKKDNIPVGNQAVVFEIVGPVNSYQNISALIGGVVTNSLGIGSATYGIPLPAEHAKEIVQGAWTVQSEIGLDIDTVGDAMNFEVAPLSTVHAPEFPAWTFLALTFLLATLATVALARSRTGKRTTL